MPWLASSEALLQGRASVIHLSRESLSVLCVLACVITGFRLALPVRPALDPLGVAPTEGDSPPLRQQVVDGPGIPAWWRHRGQHHGSNAQQPDHAFSRSAIP